MQNKSKPFFSLLEDEKTLKVEIGDDGLISNVLSDLQHKRRDIEDLCREKTWQQALPIVERICGICSLAHTNAFIRALEGLARVDVPRRANYIRVVYSEMERITSHLMWMAVLAETYGLDFKRVYRTRETILSALEKTRGIRVHPTIHTLGGTTFDMTQEDKQIIAKAAHNLETQVKPIFDDMLSDERFISSIDGFAKIDKDDVREYGLVGPLARASGVPCDERTLPYFAYEELGFEEVLGKAGDSLERLRVRMNEILVSCDLILTAIEKMPEGPVVSKAQPGLTGRTAGTCEAPRGLNLHEITIRNDVIEDIHITTPTNRNLRILPKLLIGISPERINSTLLTIDPCYTCAERIIVVKGGEEYVFK